jgi:hypothetical protein
VQVRVLVLVFSLLLVIVMMLEARKPQNWQWMFAGSKSRVAPASRDKEIDTRLPPERVRPEDPLGTVYANESVAARPASTSELAKEIAAVDDAEDARQRIRRDAWRDILKQLGRDERTILERLLRNSRGGPAISTEDLGKWSTAFSKVDQAWKDYLTSSSDAVLVAGDELPAEQRSQLLNALRDLEVEWANLLRRGLRAVLEDRPWTELERETLAKLQATLDELASAAIRDDMVFRAEEQTAWFRSFEKLLALSDRELSRQSLGNVGFVQLFRQTNEYRGQLVTISGTAELAYRVAAPQNDLAIDRYYVFWLRPGDGSDSPMVVYALELPEGFPAVGSDHTTLSEELTCTGTFFKRWAYASHDGIRTAPMILVKRPAWQPTPSTFSVKRPSFANTMAVVLGLAVLAIAIARWVYCASNSLAAHRPAASREPTSQEFAALAERKIGPTISEALQQLADHEKRD